MLSSVENIDIDEDNLLSFIESFDDKSTENIIDTGQCLNCNGKNLVKDNSKGCMKCTDCGACIQQLFDENPEWSMYEDGKGEGAMRCGAATNYFLPKSSLGTTISGKKSVLKMLQNWNQMPYKERSLSDILQYLEQVCKKNNLPKSVIDNVKILYKQIHDLKYDIEEKKDKSIIIRGDKRRGVYGACIYYGSQLQGYSRSIKEIGLMLEISSKTVTKGCRKFNDLMKKNNLINTITITIPNDFIERYCYKLKLKKDQIEQIMIITSNISKLYLASNHQPTSIAAGAILIYANLYNVNIDKKTISDIFEISNVTIDKIYKKILPFRNVINSDELTTFVKNKLMDAKYIMVNEKIQEELTRNANIFKQNIIELSDSSSDYNDIISNDEPEAEPELVSIKKKRGRKSKNISNSI